MGSIATFSLYCQLRVDNPKFPKHSLPISSKPQICVQRLHQLPFNQAKLHISSILPLSPIPHVPTSNLSKRNDFLAKFLCEKLLASLVGAFIFIGSFGLNTKPSLALPSQTTESSAKIEEKKDTQKSEDEMYEEILKGEPRNVEALKVLVYGMIRRGKTKEALKYVDRLINIEPEEVEWRLLEALCYEMLGQLSKAKRLFKEILEERPLLLRALHGLAMVMHKNLEGPAVFEMLNKALEIACREKRVTEERNIRILIAQMHVVKGQLEEGLKKFQDLVNENPRDFRPYLCQGIIYSLLDRKKEAAEQFETYHSLVPDEFPQRGFLDDVVLAAKTESQERFQKEFVTEFSYRK
ncbi:hypothetical protein P3X46_018403 [Hevea brasiliensis]|uniref:Bacterial transcriptional activator domain-containing protein n=1 Tax=Hevea brasiliensis TaxID=3981 RepID=A0ABQ9LRW1_HEVBR|nr:protein SLOW GREEN 1, chloroplastic isoform X2 [Hevea brasiliensis]KAJ9170283.1 hypothetical protein P3X46_018403 [Hevea brasiliensis]